jgi:hypothetical protein
MEAHSISPHFFHSGGEEGTTVVDVPAGEDVEAELEEFAQDKSTGNKQEIQSILLMKRRRYRTWRGYDIC